MSRRRAVARCGSIAIGLSLVLSTVAGGAMADPAPPQAPPGLFSANPEPVTTKRFMTDATLIAARQDADAKAAARKRFLASADMRSQRRSSQSAFRGLSRARAIDVTRQWFPQMSDWHSYDPSGSWHGGLNIVRFEDDWTAQVMVGGRHMLLDSEIALRPLGSDSNDPVDLRLESTDAGFAPKNPLVPVTLPSSLADGMTVGGDGVRLIPEGQATGTVDGDQVVYANTQTDTDTDVRAVPQGLELSTVIRSADSPESTRIDVQMPEGATLVATDQGAVVQDADKTLTAILPPTATDAEGQDVPTTMTVDGDHTLVITTEHQGRDVAYPIAVARTLRTGAQTRPITTHGGQGTRRACRTGRSV